MLVTLRKDVDRGVVELEVADTGMGISDQDLPHVFDRFFRGDKSRQRENLAHGNGLGLSICQSIVVSHGGEVRAESAPAGGATFLVSLPMMHGKSRDVAHAEHAGHSV